MRPENALGRFEMGRYVRQLRVFIASPSDVEKERREVFNAVSDLNRTLHAESIALQPVGWEYDAYPQISDDGGQSAINSQLLFNSDVLIGFIGFKPGKPTRFFESGTIEEIERFIELGRPTLIYFKRFKADNYETKADGAKIKKFKNSLFKRGLIGSFSNPSELKVKIERDLTKSVTNFKNDWDGRVGDLLYKAEESNFKFANAVGNFRVGLDLSDMEECRCACVCFKVVSPESSYYGVRWEKIDEFNVETHGYIERRKLLEALQEPYNSFKFYISVDENKLDRFRGRLLDKNMNVTGKGDPDPEKKGNWRIWFLLPEGYIHPLVESPEYANHSLFDLCVI